MTNVFLTGGSGLIGGALSMLAFSRLGRTHGIYGRPGMLGIAGVIAARAGGPADDG